MSEVIEQESTELVTLPPKETALSVYSTVGGLGPLIDQIRAKIAGTVYDMATKKGRDECASDAFKVAKSKTAIERLGKALSAEYKEIPKKIDAERKRAFDALEALQKEVRQPLTEWEEAEETRISGHKIFIELIQQSSENVRELSANTLREKIAALELTSVDGSLEEFETEAHRVKARSLEIMNAHLVVCEKHEAEQAELAKLRAEAEARRIQDEKDRIAKEAAEAATKAAEAKAKAEREAAAKAADDAKAEADRREMALKLQAETAERQRLEAIQKAEKDQAEAMERERQADERAKAEAVAAAERATQAAEAARLAEVKRQADEAARIEAEAKAREADRAHKSGILRKAKEAVMTAGVTEDQARAIVILITAGKVPNVSFQY